MRLSLCVCVCLCLYIRPPWQFSNARTDLYETWYAYNRHLSLYERHTLEIPPFSNTSTTDSQIVEVITILLECRNKSAWNLVCVSWHLIPSHRSLPPVIPTLKLLRFNFFTGTVHILRQLKHKCFAWCCKSLFKFIFLCSENAREHSSNLSITFFQSPQYYTSSLRVPDLSVNCSTVLVVKWNIHYLFIR